jgi:tRNA-specific 2-thiouridylase
MKTENKAKVLVGMSGGVDSSVAALLLKKIGFQVHAVFLRNYPDEEPYLDSICPFKPDKQIAEKICKAHKIPFEILDYRKTYLEDVIKPMFQSYSKGETPNPDTYCNLIVKFPALWKHAKKIKADFIATGHYSRIAKTKQGFQLLQGKDKTKDQSYFLYQLTQSDLSHTIFPNGNLTKTQVRKLAKSFKLPNWNKKSSRGICFIGKLDFKEFLKKKLPPKPGKIKDPEGNTIGTHQGTMFFTIGEKLGTKHNTKIQDKYRNKVKTKLYVAEKKANTITVAPKNHPILKKRKITIRKFHKINPKQKIPKNLKARIRHLGSLLPGKLTKKSNKYLFVLKKPIEALAPGQAIVLYNKQQLIAGGEISKTE